MLACEFFLASDRRTLGQQLVVWDMYGLTGRALPCSAGGPSAALLSAATLGFIPLPGLNITCVQWSPSGQFIAVGCRYDNTCYSTIHAFAITVISIQYCVSLSFNHDNVLSAMELLC